MIKKTINLNEFKKWPNYHEMELPFIKHIVKITSPELRQSIKSIFWTEYNVLTLLGNIDCKEVIIEYVPKD